MEKDPLDNIFTNPEELDIQRKKVLAEILNPFARLDVESGAFLPTIIWLNLNTKKKILIYILSKLALSTKNQMFNNSSSPKEIEEITEIPGGTVRPKLKELMDEKLIFRNEMGAYYVKPTLLSLQKIKSLFESDLMIDSN